MRLPKCGCEKCHHPWAWCLYHGDTWQKSRNVGCPISSSHHLILEVILHPETPPNIATSSDQCWLVVCSDILIVSHCVLDPTCAKFVKRVGTLQISIVQRQVAKWKKCYAVLPGWWLSITEDVWLFWLFVLGIEQILLLTGSQACWECWVSATDMFIAAFSVDFERVSHGSYSSTDPEEHSHLLRVWCEAHLGSMPQAKFDMPQSGLMVYQPGQDPASSASWFVFSFPGKNMV